MGPRVLIADDDRAIRESLPRPGAGGLRGVQRADGVEALTAIRKEPPDIAIVDVMMPGVDGLGVCRVVRADGSALPILMLTARVEVGDRVAGLDAGADDYFAKPFDLDELFARLRALLRRASTAATSAPDVVTVGELHMELGRQRVWWGQHEVVLSRTEFALLELLARNAGIVLPHAAIYDRIWGYDFGPDSKNQQLGLPARQLHEEVFAF